MGTYLTGAQRLLDDVTDDPERVASAALDVMAKAHRAGDLAAESVATWALGLAQRETRQLDQAEASLRRAAEIAGDEPRHHEINVTLALTVALRGDTETALGLLETSIAALDGPARGRATIQRGLLRQRLGDDRGALDDYDRALPALTNHDWQWLARLHNNRGLLLTTHGHFAEADGDLAASEALWAANGHAVAAWQVHHNRGWLAARAGDVPRALQMFQTADQQLRTYGPIHPTSLLDRAAVLLDVGLTGEATRLTRAATAAARSQDMEVDLAEALLAHARSTLAANDVDGSAMAGREAESLFRHQGRAAWEVLARLEVLRAKPPADHDEHAAEAARLSEQLAARGWTLEATNAGIIAAEAALLAGRPTAARDLLAVPTSTMTSGQRARAWLVTARMREALGDRRGAAAALRSAMTMVERHRALLGASELRAATGALAATIADDGLGHALKAGSPRQVLRWAERARAGSLWHPPLRPPGDDLLAADLAALRRVTAELRHQPDGGDAVAQRRTIGQLEASVRRRAQTAAGSQSVARDRNTSIDELMSTLADRALVEFVDHDGQLSVLVAVGNRVHHRRLGATQVIASAVSDLAFSLRRLGDRRHRMDHRVQAADLLERTAHHVAELLSPAWRLIGDREVVLVPTGGMHAAPWALLPPLHARAFTVAPSALLWMRSQQREVRRGRAVVVAGPELDHANHEAQEVASLLADHVDTTVLTGDQAGTSAVMMALDGAGLGHLIAHGNFRTDHPLFSSLQLADGPLMVYDLESMSVPPREMVLSACNVGLSQVSGGDELMGLVASLLAMGTRTVTASVVTVADAETAAMMAVLYERRMAGIGPAAGLAAARQAVRRDHGLDGIVAAAGFTCFGAG